MKRQQLAPGIFLTELPGEKFKRCRIITHFIVPGQRKNATALALLPNIMDRSCAAVPDATALSRLLFSLYGAELSSDSYTTGCGRVLSFSISGLKNEFALDGEDLTARYLDLLCNILFAPKLGTNGGFDPADVAIEKEKQAEFLKCEMNDKRVYCLRQARRKLYGTSPLGIESSGYLEDLDAIDGQNLYAEYTAMLNCAHVEIMVCGANAALAGKRISDALDSPARAPIAPETSLPLPLAETVGHYEEPMDTVQGKLCMLFTSGRAPTLRDDSILRMAAAILGGLPTSRLFTNVREKQSLCYYCAAVPGYFSGTLSLDSGIDHKNATKAAKAILRELQKLQKKGPDEDEMTAARLYLGGMYTSAKDSPDALMHWAFGEWQKGGSRTLDDATAELDTITAEELRDALAAFMPAVEYVITGKGGKAS